MSFFFQAAIYAATLRDQIAKALREGNEIPLIPARSSTEQIIPENPNLGLPEYTLTDPVDPKKDLELPDATLRLDEKSVGTIDQTDIIQADAKGRTTVTTLEGLSLIYDAGGGYTISFGGEEVARGKYDQPLADAYNAQPDDERKAELLKDLGSWRDKLLESPPLDATYF